MRPPTASRRRTSTSPGRTAPRCPAAASSPDRTEQLGDLGRACRPGIRERTGPDGGCLRHLVELVLQYAEVAQALVAGEAGGLLASGPRGRPARGGRRTARPAPPP